MVQELFHFNFDSAFFGHDELITQMEPGHAKWADVLETAQLFKSAKCDVQHTINCLAAGFSLPLLDSTILQSTYCKFFLIVAVITT